MKTKEEILFERGIKFPAKRSPRDFNLALIAMESYSTQQLAEQRKKIQELRDDIEKQTETMDLIKDSDFIQILGSIVGRLNEIINEP